MTIFEEFESHKIDYTEVRSKSTVVLKDKREVDVSVIIPVFERGEFNNIVTKHLKDAIFHSGKKISITFVEHSEKQDHRKLCGYDVNYIHIPKLEDEPFNKCLAHNIGALYSNKARYFLFHDVDTLMKQDFFIRIFKNLKDNDALHSFTKRRLLYCNEALSERLIGNSDSLKNIRIPHDDIKVGTEGAVGGSILINSEFFFSIGGYGAEFFTEYSLEDQFFWDCITAFGKIESCDNPPIEMFHLHHGNLHRIMKQHDEVLFDEFRALNPENRDCLINERSKHLIKFKIK